MAKICVIGEYESICGFSALGIDIFTAESPEKTTKLIENLAVNDYCIILITENTAGQIESTLEKYRTLPTPAIIPIPSPGKDPHIGMDALRTAVEQAVGSAEMVFGS